MNRESVAGIELTTAGGTDLGRVRRNNEDAFLIADLSDPRTLAGTRKPLAVGDRRVLLAVSDGLGGSQAGEVASALALDTFRLGTSAALAQVSPDAALRKGAELANREVAAAATSAERVGMGATLTACLLHGGSAYIAEVGDSRAYVLRSGHLVQLTTDQSYVQLLVDSGVSREQANQTQLKNVILQAIGKAPEVTPGISRLELRRGDQLLLCTDGLTNMAPEGEIASIIAGAPSVEEACSGLIARANSGGGRDNVTVIVARVEGSGVPEARAGEDFSKTFRTLAIYKPTV